LEDIIAKERVVDDRLVVDREQILVHHLCKRVETGANANE